MPRLRSTISLGLAGLISAGCIHYGGAAPRNLASVLPNDRFMARFDYTVQESIPEIVRERNEDDFTEVKLRFLTRRAYFYKPNGASMAPAVVILPITQGDYYTRALAEFLTRKGFAVLRFQSEGELQRIRDSEDMLADFERMLREYIVDVRRGIDWLQGRADVDRHRIGVAGISLGAIIGQTVMGVDPRLGAGAFLLGGGDLAGILFASDEKSIVRVRDRIRQQTDLSDKALNQRVAEGLVHLDPLTYAERIDPSRVLMISASFDEVIPKKFADRLWRKMGKPTMVRIPTGHYTAGLYFLYAEQLIADHLFEVLNRPRPIPRNAALPIP